MSQGFKFVTISVGTATHVVASFDPSITSKCLQIVYLLPALTCSTEHNGAYLAKGVIAPPEEVKEYALDKENAERLWKVSEKIVGETFEY